MRPGILIQHSRQPAADSTLVRSDAAAVLGVIGRSRWPRGAGAGDFVDLTLTSWWDLADHPLRQAVDPVAVHAVRTFFVNGGERCRLVGFCTESADDLTSDVPSEGPLSAVIAHLRGLDDIGLILMPALAYLPVTVDRLGRAEVAATPMILELLEHCREMNNRFLIVDPPAELHDSALIGWAEGLRERARESASFGALYYPWLNDGDDMFPPSGAVAGLYARSEIEHAPFGVRWPPANQALRGVTHPSLPVRWRESDVLIEAHVNPILTQPTRGVLVWGARTLSKDPRWRYVNSRRIASVVAEQLRRDSEWVVFEEQRPELWEMVARNVRARLDMIWGAGLLTGDQEGTEYEVQCDAELNPPEVRDAGQVHVRVRIRPISTAEHIVIDLRLGS
ncbi:MAG: phage tail sheath subtilisin-like domain-containing protein [Myxococcales bacterium]|nr:phage tail sheath subtilisin-like domain-containing protein [Myxococcales bacterium]